MSAILSLEPSQHYAGMLGLLVQFCTNHKEMDVVNQHKVSGEWGHLMPGVGVAHLLASPALVGFFLPRDHVAFAVILAWGGFWCLRGW